MLSEMKIEVLRHGCQVSVLCGQYPISIELAENSTDISQSDDFALWLGLPFALSEGRDLRICGTVSDLAIKNARRISEYWSFWLPGLFKPIRILADEEVPPPNIPNRNQDIMCFSGGMDSTYALVNHVQTTGNKPALLTVHGLDYNINNPDSFMRLLSKTEPTRTEFGSDLMSVRSNARELLAAAGIPGDISFAFNLFACLFLFQHKYASGLISADNPHYYEWARMPYGSNSMSNPLFDNGKFGIQTLSLDVSRSQKAGFLAQYPEVVETLSMCKSRSVRPENCGVCDDCWRAKALFYAETGKMPDIFIDPAFDTKDLSHLNPDMPNFHVVAVDIAASARRNGRIGEFSELLDFIVRNDPRTKRQSKIRKISLKLRARFRNIWVLKQVSKAMSKACSPTPRL